MVTRRDQIPMYDRVFRRFFLDEADALPEPLRLSRAVYPGRAVGAADPGHRARPRGPGGAGGPARTGRLRRGGAAEQGVHRVHRGGARHLAADHGADAAHPTASAYPADCPAPAPGVAPDLRRTVRETMRMHGEPSRLFWRRRRLRLRPLILILDVSGSMADYSRHLLQFAYSATARQRPGRGVLLRHPTHPDHPRPGAAPGRRRDGAGCPGRLRLGGRDPDRWVPGRVRPGLGTARRVPRRHRGDLLRRAGPGRPPGAGHRDGAAVAAESPGGVDEPAQGRPRRLPAEHPRHDGRGPAHRPGAVRSTICTASRSWRPYCPSSG